MSLHRLNTTQLLTSQLKFKWLCYNAVLDVHLGQQVRHASLIKRPYRPYTFTQLIVLSDGSTFTMRTTSPAPVYKSAKDSRNHPLWQPSSAALRNVETDEAGRLRAFRKRFGHGWDAEEIKQETKKNSNDIKIRTRSGNRNVIGGKDLIKDEQQQQLLPGKTIVIDRMMDLINNAAINSVNTSATGREIQDKSSKVESGERLRGKKFTPEKDIQVKTKDSQ
ncbi:hypothetical protein HI914_05271 [Erysiphe necator]|uniref:Putative 50s ribosomal protein n=1 Tax=Uncinula necator TaxID=52586 RepID=A0A0B1P6T5_UNCNE|nr:hypothetical protein HI914_05271 [Erysiphe necator]KHJ32359.1 putative 50s ribosomal protein [Erysiphe necator]